MYSRDMSLPSLVAVVDDDLARGSSAGRIISKMIAERIATIKTSAGGNTLRARGVTGSCTWSVDAGLLASWRRNAAKRLGGARLMSAADKQAVKAAIAAYAARYGDEISTVDLGGYVRDATGLNFAGPSIAYFLKQLGYVREGTRKIDSCPGKSVFYVRGAAHG